MDVVYVGIPNANRAVCMGKCGRRVCLGMLFPTLFDLHGHYMDDRVWKSLGYSLTVAPP